MKHYSPTTSNLRNKNISEVSISKYTGSIKHLNIKWKRSKGRNNQGNITSLHRGGGHKRIYRSIDFWYANYGKDSTLARIIDIKVDSYRTSYIALIKYLNGILKNNTRYVMLTHSLKIGDIISFGPEAPEKLGNSKPLNTLSLGTNIHSIEQYPNKGASLVRSAGTSAKLIALDHKYATIKLPSGEIRKINNKGFAVIGTLSNITKNQEKQSKAGQNRYKSIRPRVRGTAMNAVDHPHGGGEGKSSRGHKSIRSRWGIYKKGTNTRSKTKKSTKLIVKNRKK